MKKTLTVLGIVIAFSILSTGAIALDANNPYTVDMKWIVPSDTSFTVSLCGSQTSVDFDDNLNSQTTDSEIEPNCQNVSTTTPLLTISNDGNVAQNFTGFLQSARPAFVDGLWLNNAADFASATDFDTTAVDIATNVASGNSVDVYYWTNVSNADQGTTTRTKQINSTQA